MLRDLIEVDRSSRLARHSYEPFGATTATGAQSTNPFQYTGREHDGTGLYYHRARYYHPGLQRFLSEDPLDISEVMLLRQGDPTHMNLARLYSILLSHPELLHPSLYVANDPLNYSDPTGEIIPQVAGCAIGAGIEIGLDVLSGRKINWLTAAGGCALGAIGAFPIGAKIGVHGAHHFFPTLGKRLPHIQITVWEKGVKGSHRNWHIPLP